MTFKNKDIFKWGVFITSAMILLSILIYALDNETLVTNSYNNETLKSSIEILINNTKNFLGYLILFPIMPLKLFFDLFSITSNLYYGIKILGFYTAFMKLYAHILLEFPNIIIYTFLSYENFKILRKDKSLKKVILNMNGRKYYYIISYILLIIAAIVEGYAYV